MSPEHNHTMTVRARRWRWLPIMRTDVYDRICSCKRADHIAGVLREMADESGSPLELTLHCDMRGTVKR